MTRTIIVVVILIVGVFLFEVIIDYHYNDFIIIVARTSTSQKKKRKLNEGASNEYVSSIDDYPHLLCALRLEDGFNMKDPTIQKQDHAGFIGRVS